VCLALPVQIVATDPERSAALVEIEGVQREICTMLLDTDSTPGDWVIVHVGFALCRLHEDAARETLALLAEGRARSQAPGKKL